MSDQDDYSPDEIERMRQIADGYKDVVPPLGPRLDWTHTDACNFLMSDPESDTYHASRCLLDQIVALEETERKQLAEVERLRAELKDQREPGCQCTWEVGDSPCPAHPLNPATELPYTAREAAKLEAENAELRKAGKGLCSNCGFACSIVDETEQLNAKLAWFEEREKWFDGCDGAVQYARESWASDHPKPTEGA
jgi:hypothetical protein